MDDVRGWVTIVGMTDAPIPWPIGKRGRARSRVVYQGLARAVRNESNQAMCRAWGVTPQTVSKWRKALGVPQENDGTRRLHSLNALSSEFEAIRKKAWSKARDPERRAKIATAKRSVPRPPGLVEKLRLFNFGRKLSAETRFKMSETHRKRGSRPPKAGRPWTLDEDSLLTQLPPKIVAERTGRTLRAVYSRRIELGLPDGRTTRHQTATRTTGLVKTAGDR